MSKIDRFNGDLKAFGSDATGTERTVFGDTSQSDTLDDNLTSDFFRGWGLIGENGFPPREWFNAVGFTATQLLAYLHQMGVAEYNSSQEYHTGSICIDGTGKIYISKIDDNVGNALPADSDVNWKRVLDFADLNDTALTGNPTASTQLITDDSTRIATTEFVKNVMSNSVEFTVNYDSQSIPNITFTEPTGGTIVAPSTSGQTLISGTNGTFTFEKKCNTVILLECNTTPVPVPNDLIEHTVNISYRDETDTELWDKSSSFSSVWVNREQMTIPFNVNAGHSIRITWYHNHTTSRNMVGSIRVLAFNIEE
jgi:hypothetical protein